MGLFGSRKNSLMGRFNPQQGGHWSTPGIGDEIDPAEMQSIPSAPNSAEQGGGLLGKILNPDALSKMSGSFARAGALFAGDSSGYAGLASQEDERQNRAAALLQQQAQQQQLFKAYAAAGLSPEKARLAAMGGAKFGDLAPTPAADPERVRTAQWWQNATPEQRTAFDQTNPIVTQGYGSAMVPRATLPQSGAPQAPAGAPAPGQVEDGYQFMGGDPTNPNSWKPVGGGGGNVTGGFR